MKILSFDTSTQKLSIALFEGSKKIDSYDSEVTGRHSQELIPGLQRILKRAHVRPKEVGCIAVGVGPGSFTGLRIAVTTAKVFCYTLKTKLVGISSLEAIARSATGEGEFAVLMDAKKAQVYAAIYRKKGEHWQVIQKPALVLREHFLQSLNSRTAILEAMIPSAVSIAQAAMERIRLKKFDDPLKLEPLYLHPKDCNVAPSSKK